MSGTCGVLNVRVSVAAPSGGTTGLITIPNPTTASIAFAASSALTDAGAYTVTVQAGYGVSIATVVTSAVITYNYADPCPTATITTFAFSSITVPVGSSATESANLWYDSISGSATTLHCGTFTWTFIPYVVSAPSYVEATMGSIFAMTFSTTQALMTVTPTQTAEAGTYTVAITACLTNYDTICDTLNVAVTIPCVSGVTLSPVA